MPLKNLPASAVGECQKPQNNGDNETGPTWSTVGVSPTIVGELTRVRNSLVEEMRKRMEDQARRFESLIRAVQETQKSEADRG